MLTILALSGSLRRGSSNAAIVEAAQQCAPPGMRVAVFESLDALPHFNPDVEQAGSPAVVTAWRKALASADAVFISSPEYAHGVPGVLKNALDWVVGSGEFMMKPVALVNASAMSTFVTEQLRETLTVMMGQVVVATSLPLNGRPQSANDVLAQPDARTALEAALKQLADIAAPPVVDATLAHPASGNSQ